MFTLLWQSDRRRALIIELPSLAISMVIAEFLYKFKSFTLEFLAFLLTWVAIGALLYGVRALVQRGEAPKQE